MSANSLDTIRADFDRIARLVALRPDRPERYERFVLAQIPTRCASVLEIGCGAGRLARAIAARGARVTGLDASPEMIRLARDRTRAGDRVELVCGDFAALVLAREAYDCVVSVTTLHHLPAEPALSRMKSLLQPGGVLVVHDVRSSAGRVDWLRSAVAAAGNGDAVWWIGRRLRSDRDLREAWHDHGKDERYPTMAQVDALCAATLPGAKTFRHPLWRYTVVWVKGRPNGRKPE
jgi:SAM-dependent methyltransferase